MHEEGAEDATRKRSACGAGRGRNPREGQAGASKGTARRGGDYPEQTQLMEAVVGRENMFKALRRVESNQGPAGVDGLPVTGLRDYLTVQWPSIRE